MQAKGTRSAKRRAKKLSGREKRFSLDVNHVITKAIAQQDGFAVFVLEDLSGIRKQRRGRKLNKWISSWPFYQFTQFLIYKAEALGKTVEFIDPKYTSQRCNICGHIDKKNRKKSRFCCTNCGHRDHADVNAAKNIRDVYLSATLTFGSVEQAGALAPCQAAVCDGLRFSCKPLGRA